METLHDKYTICNKEQMMLCLTIAQALEELEKAREVGDDGGVAFYNGAIKMLIEQIEPIEE